MTTAGVIGVGLQICVNDDDDEKVSGKAARSMQSIVKSVVYPPRILMSAVIAYGYSELMERCGGVC